MNTVYLVFPDQDTAIAALTAAGYTMDEYNAHCQGDGWGPLFSIADETGHYCNLYDCNNLAESLQQYTVAAPLTPYNVRVGDDVQLVNLTVYVTAAIRDQARAMVVQIAGPTHANMWETPVTRNGDQWYVNSGPVRVELAAMLDDAATLAAGTGITLQEAQYILSQCIVSDDDPHSVMAQHGMVMVS